MILAAAGSTATAAATLQLLCLLQRPAPAAIAGRQHGGQLGQCAAAAAVAGLGWRCRWTCWCPCPRPRPRPRAAAGRRAARGRHGGASTQCVWAACCCSVRARRRQGCVQAGAHGCGSTTSLGSAHVVFNAVTHPFARASSGALRPACCPSLRPPLRARSRTTVLSARATTASISDVLAPLPNCAAPAATACMFWGRWPQRPDMGLRKHGIGQRT